MNEMRQLPSEGEIFLDHIAYFAPSMTGAQEILRRMGFTLTPFTAQQNRTPKGFEPAGTANRCAMLRQGYLEVLTAVSDTPLSRRFEQAVGRYTGLHLVAFSESDPEAARRRLQAEGFAPDLPINLTRPAKDESGRPAEARFSVLRVPHEAMPEGRVQILTHHTEDVVWQTRFLAHTNAVVSLEAVLLVVNDPQGTAERFGRFTGRVARASTEGRWILPLDRGAIVFVPPKQALETAPLAKTPSATPWIAGCALGSRDPEATWRKFSGAGLAWHETSNAERTYALPPELGGIITVVPAGRPASWAL